MSSIFDLKNDEIFLLTTQDNNQDNGMIITWFMPASLVSGCPRVISSVSPKNLTTELIRKSGHFVAHLLSDEQLNLVPTFGLNSGRDINKFKDVKFDRLKSGLPILNGTCGWMECKIVHEFDCGDRILLLSDVISQKIHQDRKPLTKSHLDIGLSEEIKLRLKEKLIRDSTRDLALFKMLK